MSAPKVVSNAKGGTDQAAVTALAKADAARQKALSSGNAPAIARATANVKKAQATVSSRNKAAVPSPNPGAVATRTGTGPSTTYSSPGPIDASSNPGSGDVTVGQDPLVDLTGQVQTMSGGSGGSNRSGLASQVAALTSQLSGDESTIANQQTQLDAMTNSSNGSAATTTSGGLSSITSLFSSTTGKLVLLGVLAVGGWYYLKKHKEGSGVDANYREGSSDEVAQ